MVVTEGERRVVAVLMADVAGSTAIGEQLGPERSKFLFDEVVRLMAEQVERYEGTVAQLLGDGLLAVFGAPVAHEDDSERAVRARRSRSSAPWPPTHATSTRPTAIELRARVAVNTGPVLITPDADGPDRFNALGDTVNVTARLQALAGRGRCHARRRHRRPGARLLRARGSRADGAARARPPGRPIPGRERARAHRTARRRAADRARRRSSRAVRDAVERLADGIGVIVSLTGEPGIGKSRLLAEAVVAVPRPRCGCSSAAASPTPRASRTGRSATCCATGWAPRRRRARRACGSTSRPRCTSSTAPRRRPLPVPGQPARPAGDRPPGGRRPARALARCPAPAQPRGRRATCCGGCREERPLLVVFEDLHWADDLTLQAVESLLELTETEALGIALLYRSERELPSWGVGERARQHYPHRYVEVELRALGSDATLALAQALADAPLPDTVADLIAQRAGGNPLFVSEALRDLVERGALRRANGGWELAVDPDALEVPALVQGVLQARLDRLDAAGRETVAVAAAIGRRFGMPLLERVLDPETLRRGAARAAAARPDRRGAPPPVPGVPLPARARPGGCLRPADRVRPPDAPPPGRLGARGARRRRPERGHARPAGPPLQRRRRPGQGGRVPDPGGRRRADDLRQPGGDPALPACARVPGPDRRRPPLPRDALQDRARPPPGVQLRRGRARLRRGLRLQGGADRAAPADGAARDRTPAARGARAGPRVRLRDERAHRAPLPRAAHDRPRPERDAVAGRELPRVRRRPDVPLPAARVPPAGATASRSRPTISSTPGSAPGSARR